MIREQIVLFDISVHYIQMTLRDRTDYGSLNECEREEIRTRLRKYILIEDVCWTWTSAMTTTPVIKLPRGRVVNVRPLLLWLQLEFKLKGYIKMSCRGAKCVRLSHMMSGGGRIPGTPWAEKAFLGMDVEKIRRGSESYRREELAAAAAEVRVKRTGIPSKKVDLWSLVEISREDVCWPWSGPQISKYPAFEHLSSTDARKSMHILEYGRHPWSVKSICRSRLCMRPTHLVFRRLPRYHEDASQVPLEVHVRARELEARLIAERFPSEVDSLA